MTPIRASSRAKASCAGVPARACGLPLLLCTAIASALVGCGETPPVASGPVEVVVAPVVQRDVAVIVDAGLEYQAILDALQREQPGIVTEIVVFDVYQGEGIEKGKKSLAFRVLLQDTHKTLTDAEVDSAVSKLIQVLQQRFSAKLR